MRHQALKSFISTGIIATVLLSIGMVAEALDTNAVNAGVPVTLQKFYALDSSNKYLAEHAAAVLVFPTITKGGIGIGGEHGDGALQQNGKTVGYYSISGASIGVTFGLSDYSQVILFNTADALNTFLNTGDWSVGADASVAVAKSGATATAESRANKKPVLVYTFGAKGLIGDASLGGTKISKIAQ